MIKKVLALLMVSAMAASMVACDPGTKSNKSSPTATTSSATNTADIASSDAPKEVKNVKLVTTWDPGYDITSESKIFTEWGKRTGLKFEVTINPRDNHKEKVNILLASKEIPDMLKFFQDDVSYNSYGSAFFEPLDSYLEAGKLPNLEGYLKKYPEIESKMRNTVDGRLYGFGLVQDFEYFSNLWYVRNDMLKSQGLDATKIKNLDDFKAACLALKKAKGGDYITSSRLGFGYYFGMTASYWGMPASGIVFDGATSDATKKFVLAPIQYKEKLKEYIEFEKWMIDNKLLHPNVMTMKDQDLFAGYNDGSFPLQREQFTMAYTGVSHMNPNEDPKIEIAPIYPFEVNGSVHTLPKFVHYNIAYRSPWVVSNKSNAKDEIMAAMDYMYSPEGVELNFMGIEGETFERDASTPSGYKLKNVQSVWTKNADGTFPDGMKMLQDHGFKSWWLAGVVPAYERFTLINYTAEQKEKAFATTNEAEYMNKNGFLRDADPSPTFTKEESDQMANIMTPINTYIEENVSQFILGSKPMSQYDEFIAAVEKFDYKSALDLYNSKIS